MSEAESRRARDDEVDTWREHGWVLLEGLVGGDEIAAAAQELTEIFPTAEAYHADPEGETNRWIGHPAEPPAFYTWPPEGPGFRPEQHIWQGQFPFPGRALNRMCAHPSIVDFMERALRSDDLRIYQTGLSAKYAGLTNYEQPMHTDRNHSWLPAHHDGRYWHVESFLYLVDVDEGNAPTHLVSTHDSVGRSPTAPLYMPRQDPELYGAERAAPGRRGSLLAYRPDVFHRGTNLTAPGAARFFLNVSYRHAAHEWIGYHSSQSRATSPHWVAFVEGSTPRELELFGFPPPGHAVWDAALLDATASLYPNLDLQPWRAALAGARG